MTVCADRRALYNALKELAKLAPARSAVPTISNVHIAAQTGMVKLTATDLTTRLTAELSAEGDGQHFAALLPANLLTKLVKPEGRGDAGQVTLDAVGETVTVTTDGLATRLPAADPTEFPSAFPAEDWKLVGMCSGQALQEALSWVLPAASTDPTRRNLQSVYLSTDGQAVATDGHRLHIAPCPITHDTPLLIPSSAAATMARIFKASGGQVVVARHTTEEHDLLRVRCGCFELTTRLMDEQFPPYQQVIPVRGSHETAVIFDTKTMSKALRRVMQLSERNNVRVCVNGAVTLSPSGQALGEVEVVVPTIENNHSGDDLEVGLDGRYLADSLPRDAGAIEMQLGKPLDPVRLDLPRERVAVVMPLRL